jgi:hypothetical protein
MVVLVCGSILLGKLTNQKELKRKENDWRKIQKSIGAIWSSFTTTKTKRKQRPILDERLKKNDLDGREKNYGKPNGIGSWERNLGTEPMAND